MKKLIPILFLILFFPVSIFAQTTGWSWVRTTASAGSANAITRDKWGNLFVTGNFEWPSVTIGNNVLYSYGSTDVFVAKYDPQGNLLWAHSGGENGADNATGIAVDTSDNIFITGTFSGSTMMLDTVSVTGNGPTSFFVAKYDSSGIIQWAKSSNGGNLYSKGQCVASDESGNIYVSGTYIGAGFTIGTVGLPLVKDFVGIFLVKYDTNGNVTWAQWADGPGIDISYAITTDNTGGLYLTGSSTSGGISFPDNYILRNPFNGYYFPFIFKLNANNGNLVWANSPTGIGMGTGICIGADGNLYTSGYLVGDTMRIGNTTLTGGPGNAFIARYNTSGDADWAESSTDGNISTGPVIAGGADGNLYLAGQFSGAAIQFGSTTLTNSGTSSNSDMMAAAFDTSGNNIWALSAGGDSTEALSGIAPGDNGTAFVCGVAGSPSFKAGNITVNCNGEDIFLAELGTPATGIREVPASMSLNIYPNPSNGSFNALLPAGTTQIQLLNLMGQVIQTNPVGGQSQISLSVPYSGLYFVKVTAGEQSVTQKIIVTR